MEKLIGVVGVLVFILLVSNVSAYQIDWYYSNSSSVTHTNVPPFMSNLNCDLQIWENVVSNRSGAGTMKANSEWFQPSGVSVGTNERTFTSNTTCQSGLMGISNIEDTLLNGIYESNVKTTFTGTTTQYEYARVNYTCTGSNLLDYDFNVNSSYIPRAIPNLYAWDRYEVTGGAPSLTYSKDLAISVLGGNNYSYCVPTTPANQIGSDSGLTLADNETQFVAGASAINARGQKAYYLVFNSANGDVYYDVDYGVNTGFGSGASQNINTDTVLYNLNDPSNQVTLCSTVTCSGTYTLPKNELWVFMTTYFHTFNANVGVDGSANFSNPINNFSIDVYEPDYLCSEYSDCVNSTRSRICVDQGGIESDLLQTDSCVGFYEEETIGFEESTEYNIIECKKLGFNCLSYVNNITVELPTNWTSVIGTVNNSDTGNEQELAQHFMEMSTEHAVDGFKSLKMWYIPPIPDQIDQTDYATGQVACNNATGGQVPQIYGDVEQVIVFKDIEFPASYSRLNWSVRKMDSPYKQYEVADTFNISGTGEAWCNALGRPPHKLCHAVNCDVEPLGDYQFLLRRVFFDGSEPNITMYEYRGEATNDWDTVSIDLTDLGVEAGVNYRLVFAVKPDDLTTMESYGIYIDDVKVQNSYNPFSNVCNLGDGCEGTTFRDVTVSNGTCSVEYDNNNSECYFQEADRLAEETDYSGGETILDTFVVRSDLEENGLGFIFHFFDPLFLALLGIVAIGVVVEVLARTGGTVFSIILLLGSIGLFVTGLFPLGYFIVFVLIAGFIVVHTLFKGMGIGGNK